MQKNTIKNIIFDLGGVLLDLNYKRCVASFEELGFAEIDKYLSRTHPSGLFKLMECGEITVDEFVVRLNALYKSDVPKEKILAAWGSFLVTIPEQRLRLLASLKSDYKIFLLSNTSPTHAGIFEKQFILNGMLSGIDAFFDGTYYSFNLGVSKPHDDAFLRVLDRANIVADETLFIDDSEINTQAANKLGIHTITVDDVFQVNDINFECIEENKHFAIGKN